MPLLNPWYAIDGSPLQAVKPYSRILAQAFLRHQLVEPRGPGIVAVPGDADRVAERAGGDVHRIERPGADAEFQRDLGRVTRLGTDRDRALVDAGPGVAGVRTVSQNRLVRPSGTSATPPGMISRGLIV